MATLPEIKRIIIEDFAEEDQELVGKLAFSLNFFMEQTVDSLNKKLDFNNFNQELKTFEVTVDGNNTPTVNNLLKTTVPSVQGIQVISAVNISNINTYPTGTPFISFSRNADLLTLKNITGLQANNRYQLTVILYGS